MDHHSGLGGWNVCFPRSLFNGGASGALGVTVGGGRDRPALFHHARMLDPKTPAECLPGFGDSQFYSWLSHSPVFLKSIGRFSEIFISQAEQSLRSLSVHG